MVGNEEVKLNGSIAQEVSDDFEMYFPVLTLEITNFEQNTKLTEIINRNNKAAQDEFYEVQLPSLL